MDEIELEARRITQRPYENLPQQDLTTQAPPVYGDFGAVAPESVPQLRSMNSVSKPLLAEVESLDSASKLPPRSFSQSSVSKRIWMHTATATGALIMVAIPVGILLSILFINQNAPINAPGNTYCTLGSYYSTTSTGFSSTFNIDVAFGTLSFGMAKFIDLVWDVGFSRCGQAMLGWITYRVNTSALLRIMETQPVPYELFSTLSLSWSSVASFGPVIKAFFKQRGFRKKLILVWIVLNIFWVAVWPTFTNAMTGYVAENDALVKLQGEDEYVNFTDIGSVTNLAFQFYKTISINETLSTTPIGPILLSTGPNTTLWADLSQIALDSGNLENPVYYNFTNINQEYARLFYYYRNQSYPDAYFQDATNIQCIASGFYQWGFASNATGTFMILNGLWFIGTYGVWIHMNRKSELCQKGRRLGRHRAAVDLVESIHRDLGVDICTYSEKELKDELKKQGGIKYYVEHGDGDAPSHIGITSGMDRGPVRLRFGVPYGRFRGWKS